MGKVISTQAYVSALKELVEQGGEANMIIWGTSMNPFLVHNRDRIFFSAPSRPLRRGDMVFYRRQNGDYVMHRICRVQGGAYYMTGDGQTEVEGPIAREQIFALVTKVYRKGRMIDRRNFWWKFFAGPWLLLRPLRLKILRIYQIAKKALR